MQICIKLYATMQVICLNTTYCSYICIFSKTYCSCVACKDAVKIIGLYSHREFSSSSASPVPHPSCTGHGTISFPAGASVGVGSGRSHDLGLGEGGLLHLRLENGERRLHSHGYFAHVDHCSVTAVRLRDELYLLPEQLRQLGTPPELLDRCVPRAGGGRRLRW